MRVVAVALLAFAGVASAEARPAAGAGPRSAFEAAGVPAEPLELALQALRCGRRAGELDTTTLTLVDYSLRLIGLETGVNDRAYDRGIVIHGAEYATPDFAAMHGRIGRSWGCPALDPALHRDVIDTIRGGTVLFSYYPDESWLGRAAFLDWSQRPSSTRGR